MVTITNPPAMLCLAASVVTCTQDQGALILGQDIAERTREYLNQQPQTTEVVGALTALSNASVDFVKGS